MIKKLTNHILSYLISSNAKNSASGSGTRASSYHTAGGYSTNISY